MNSRWLLSTIISCAAVLSVSACATVPSEEDLGESEGSSEDALRSAVDCKETAVTGYKAGSPYAMSVITVGGKPTARATAHAFLKMQAAAEKAGVTLTISSAFRTMKEQQYFWNCYQTKACNGGHLAARPGNSPHQNGRALDLAIDATSPGSPSNAPRFGFAKHGAERALALRVLRRRSRRPLLGRRGSEGAGAASRTRRTTPATTDDPRLGPAAAGAARRPRGGLRLRPARRPGVRSGRGRGRPASACAPGRPRRRRLLLADDGHDDGREVVRAIVC